MGPCIKSTTLTGFLLSLWKTIIHFRWYLHDFEAMNSQFHPCLASMCNTRVWKNCFFVSARGGQVSQLVQRVCVAAVGATNKRKHVVMKKNKILPKFPLNFKKYFIYSGETSLRWTKSYKHLQSCISFVKDIPLHTWKDHSVAWNMFASAREDVIA